MWINDDFDRSRHICECGDNIVKCGFCVQKELGELRDCPESICKICHPSELQVRRDVRKARKRR